MSRSLYVCGAVSNYPFSRRNIPPGTSREKKKGLFIVGEFWLPDVEIPTPKRIPNAPVNDANTSGGEESVTRKLSDIEDEQRSISANQEAKVVPTSCVSLM